MHREGWICLILCVVFYGASWPVLKIGTLISQPLWFAVARLTAGCVMLMLLLAFMGRLRWPARQDWLAILSVGVFMMGIYACLNQVALQFVGAGRGSLLGYTTPIWITPIAVIFLGEKLTGLRIAGLTLGLIGLGILFNPFGFDWSDSNVVYGNGLLLLAALAWSIAILHMRVHKFRLSPLELGPWQLGVAAVVCLIAFALFEGEVHFTYTWEVAGAVGYSGLIGAALAMALATTAFRLLPSVAASIGLLGVPVLSLLLSVTLLGEELTLALGAGLLTIITGLALMSIGEARSAPA